MSNRERRRLLLLSDDNFLSEVLGTYLVRDGIDIERITTVGGLPTAIGSGVQGIVIDLAKRGISGDAILAITQCAQRSAIPVVIMSTQPRRDVADFAELVRATDVISKSEPMTTMAARIRVCVQIAMRVEHESSAGQQVDWAIAG